MPGPIRGRWPWLAVVAVVGLVGSVSYSLVRPVSGRFEPRRSTPHLVFATEPQGFDELVALGWRADSEPDRVASAALALGALTPEQLDRLATALEELADRLQAELTAIPLELEEGKPWDSLLGEANRLLPALNAATQLLSRHARTADGSFASTVLDQCPRGRHLGCVAVWQEREEAPASPEQTRHANRARFHHWPLAQAALLDFGDSATARQALKAVQAAASHGESHFGLVLDESELAGATHPETEAVRRQARRALAAVRRIQGRQQDASRHRLRQLEERLLIPLATETPPGRRLSWLTLATGDLLVVPKLGSLVSPDLVSELERALGPTLLGHARWIHRPRPLGDQP